MGMPEVYFQTFAFLLRKYRCTERSGNEIHDSMKFDELNIKYKQFSDKSLKFVHLTIVSLLKYFDEIEMMLSHIDVLGLNETRLDSIKAYLP